MIRSTSTAVFPEPAAAATRISLPSEYIASSCSFVHFTITVHLLSEFFLKLHHLSYLLVFGNYFPLALDRTGKRLNKDPMYYLFVFYIGKDLNEHHHS